MEMNSHSQENGRTNIGFEPEDIIGNPPKNMMDRDSSIDSNLSNNTGKDRPARKSTIHDLYASREKHRAKSVKACRATAEQIIHNSNTKISNMDVLFRHEEFSRALFNLFDYDATERIDQTEFIETLKINTSGKRFTHITSEKRNDIFEMIDNAVSICSDDDWLLYDEFTRVICSRGISGNLFLLADKDNDGDLSIEEVINFLIVLSTPRPMGNFSPESVQRLEENFMKHLKPGQTTLTLNEFKKMMPSKNEFFVRRVYEIFDIDGDGQLSLAEFLDKMYQYADSSNEINKVLLLFQVYDIDGDGTLQLEELVTVLSECLKESGLKLPESDVREMADALYEEALGEGEEDNDEVSIEQLKDVLAKREGLLENMSMGLNKLMLPEKPRPPQTMSTKIKDWFDQKLSLKHIKQNKQLYGFLVFFTIVNAALWIQRAYYFRDFAWLDGSKPNPFYMLSRANGRTLLFNSTLIVIVVLRYTITKLRDLGLSIILPLDNNIYIHKVIGRVIFFQAWFHTIMHLCNFAINVQPNPVQFAQLTTQYWPDFDSGPNHKLLESPLCHANNSLISDASRHIFYNWKSIGYQVPPGCNAVLYKNDSSNKCQQEFPDFIKAFQKFHEDDPNGIGDGRELYCQICDDNGGPWNIGDWLFTSKPGVFGLIPGVANPTGIALIIILTIMVICSMDFVRRSGKFQVFYFTHLLYYCYIVLLILHAPQFWKWCIVFVFIFLLEKLYRQLKTTMGVGHSYISDAKTLASRVTQLTIKRPDGFKYSPGDWVFARIPEIATYEWHPFTISSAPEDPKHVTLHIRAVGQWTNRLYDYVENMKKKEVTISRANSKKERKSLKNGLRKRSTVANIPLPKSQEVEKQEIDRANSAPSKSGQTVRYADSHIVDLTIDNNKISRPLNQHNQNCLEIHLDGPFGAPASNIFRAEHAVLIATGIGVTPFSSILQSVMFKYKVATRTCPQCSFKWVEDLSQWVQSLQKVDFFWINRDQKSFEWFLNLLIDIENEQDQCKSHHDTSNLPENLKQRFLDFHLYFTQMQTRNDMRAVGMHLAMDLLYSKKGKDVMNGLKTKTNAGRPNWDKIFRKLQEQNKGKVTVFYCGNPAVAKILRSKCEEFQFDFRKEVF